MGRHGKTFLTASVRCFNCMQSLVMNTNKTLQIADVVFTYPYCIACQSTRGSTATPRWTTLSSRCKISHSSKKMKHVDARQINTFTGKVKRVEVATGDSCAVLRQRARSVIMKGFCVVIRFYIWSRGCRTSDTQGCWSTRPTQLSSYYIISTPTIYG